MKVLEKIKLEQQKEESVLHIVINMKDVELQVILVAYMKHLKLTIKKICYIKQKLGGTND